MLLLGTAASAGRVGIALVHKDQRCHVAFCVERCCASAGEAGASDRDAGKLRTLEVAQGGMDAKGKRVWTVKDKVAEGSQATAEKAAAAEAALPSST